jgi:2'-5' RNA ligase
MRLFLAFDFGASFQSVLRNAINTLRPQKAQVKWIDPRHAHITAHFFGNVTESDHTRISRVVQTSNALHSAALSITCEEVGAFPNMHKPRTVWIGVGGQAQELERIQDLLVTDLQAAGFPVESRRFVPHITLGRVKYLNHDDHFVQALNTYKVPEGYAVALDRITLFQSDLTRQGPIYTICETFPFIQKGDMGV